jgi:hypothetical protein
MLRHPAPGRRGRWYRRGAAGCRRSTASSRRPNAAGIAFGQSKPFKQTIITEPADNLCAVEPAASGRQRAGEDQLDLRGFAFSTIPLDPGPQRDPQAGVASRATTPAEPEL